MSSNPSNSIPSESRKRAIDPIAIVLPMLLGVLRAAPFAAPFAMFLGKAFGISQGRDEPWPWALAIVSAVGFWAARLVPSWFKGQIASTIVFVLLGLGLWATWMVLTPEWDFLDQSGVTSIVAENFRFAWLLIITITFWFLTLRIALDEREQSAEAVRGMVQRSLIFLVIGVLIAALIGGDMGNSGLRAALVALPAALVSGAGAVAMSELASTRALARRRGTAVPGWDRWLRVFLGSTLVLLVLTFGAALIFGPGFIQLVIDTIRTIWSGIATVLVGIMYVLVYAIMYIARAIAWLLNAIFGTNLDVPPPPAMESAATPEPLEMEPYEDPEPWQYADAFKFGLLGFAILMGALILFRFARVRVSDGDAATDEERSSVFSGSLLRKQLRDLFRRQPHADPPRKLDLSSDPQSVREAMLYLQVLAQRTGSPRKDYETPHDFAERLQATWPSVAESLTEFSELYESVRYGETERDRAQAVSLWRAIWADRRDLPGVNE